MRSTCTLGVALAALTFSAPFALAGEGCGWGKHETASVVASAEPAEAEAPMISEATETTLVAQLDCAELGGDALASCLASLATE